MSDEGVDSGIVVLYQLRFDFSVIPLHPLPFSELGLASFLLLSSPHHGQLPPIHLTYIIF